MARDEYELLPKTLAVSADPDDAVSESAQPRSEAGEHPKAGGFVAWVTSLFDEKPYRVREGWGTTVWHLSKRVLTLCILVGAITLGIEQQSFDIATRNVWHSFQLNEDLQLAVFGLLNTVLALMVRDSLSHIADSLVTKWMVSEHGASALDFEMYDETIKPWRAVANLHARRKQNGWSLRDGLRFTVYVVVGVCLLLQGASMNTIGLPKIRWWPDTRFVNVDPLDERLYVTTPATKVATVSYMSVWDASFQTVRQGGVVSWEVSHAIAAMSVLSAFQRIYSTFSQPAGWVMTSDQASLVRNAINVTDTPTPSIQAIAIHGGKIVSMWDERVNSDIAAIRRSHGWGAKLKLNGILLDTTCYEQSEAPAGSWLVEDENNGTITIQIGPTTVLDETFSGATCSIDISQATIEISQWIVLSDFNRDHPDYSLDSYGQNRHPPITRLPPSASDTDIAKQLASWFTSILPNLHLLSSNQNITSLTSLASRLSTVIVELERGHTKTDGLAVVLSSIFSHLLTTFSWTGEEVPGSTTRHGPIRWQIYGSGPRLPWQWIAAAVIGVSITVQLVDIYYIFCRWAKGPWLELGGMLVAANRAGRMPSVKEERHGVGDLRAEDRFVRYFLRRDGEGGEGVRLVDDGMVGDGSGRYEVLGRDAVI